MPSRLRAWIDDEGWFERMDAQNQRAMRDNLEPDVVDASAEPARIGRYVRLRLRAGPIENTHGRDGRLGIRRVAIVGDSKFDAIVDAHATGILVSDRETSGEVRLLGVLGCDTNRAGSQIRHRSRCAGKVVVAR